MELIEMKGVEDLVSGRTVYLEPYTDQTPCSNIIVKFDDKLAKVSIPVAKLVEWLINNKYVFIGQGVLVKEPLDR